MASINKLSIRGVRAFSPDDQEQVIEFYFPVTIIVGANGCGKTTIIESLKYAVTGSLPPGNKSGQAFVHDPRSIGQSVVKANVKLRFTNRAGASMVVVRSMELTQKKSSLSFKALDGILRTTDPTTGERISMSHKCTELDRQIPMLLGVNKPILEHVVFCHQEDSSWPLMEGAVLKKRFDDIFDSTRYAKALKAIQDTRKEYNLVVKDLNAELAGLASHKHAAKGFRQELTQHNEQLEELEEDLQTCRDEIKKAEVEQSRNEEIAAQVEELRLEIEDRKAKLDKETSISDSKRAYLEEDLTLKHSSRELKDMLRNFGTTVEKQFDRKIDLERECQAVHDAKETIRQEEMTLQGHIGKLKAEKEAYEKLLQQRLDIMEHMAQEYGIELPVSQTQNTQNTSFTQGSLASETVGASTVFTGTHDISVSKEDMKAFLGAVNNKDAECKENLRNHREQAQKQMDHVQDQLNELHAKNKAIEHEKKKLDDELNEKRAEFQDLNSQAPSHARIRQSDITDTKRQAEGYAKERDKANSDKQLKEIPAQIRSYEGQIDKIKRDIEYDQQALRELRQNSDAQNAITVLRGQTVAELENLQESVSDHSFVFQKFNLPAPAALPGVGGGDENGDELVEALDTFATAVRDKYETVQQDLDKAKDDQASKQRVVSEKSALLAHNKQHLMSSRNKLDTLSGDDGAVSKFQRIVSTIRQFEQGAGIAPVTERIDPQNLSAHLTARIEELEASSKDDLQPEVIAKLTGQLMELSMYKNDQGAVVRQACPCCRRDFDTVTDFDMFKASLDEMKDVERSELLRSNRQQAEKSRAAKANYQRWRKAVSETMHDVLEFNRITTEVNDTEVVISDIEEELSARQSELDGLKVTCSGLQTEADELRDLVDSTKRWTEDARRLSRKKMEIGQKQVDLSISTSHIADRDLRTVEDDLNKRMAEKDELMNKINNFNKVMSELNNKIATLSAQSTRFEKMASDKQIQYDQEQQSNVRKAELAARLKSIGEETTKLHDEASSLKQKIRAKDFDRNRLRNASKEEEDHLSDIDKRFSNDISQLRQMIMQIESYIDSSKGDDLDRINEKIASLEQRTKEKETQLGSIEPELDQLNKAIDDHERHKKLIQENLDLLTAGERIKDIEKDLDRLKEDMGQVEGSDRYVQALNQCQTRLSELVENRARYEGRRGGIVDQIRTLKRKLKTPEYNDIDERHRVVMIKAETTKIAVSDLEKYYNALDKALLSFHGIKIREINRIIRELWTLTYKGDDITSIALQSGQESGNANKSYNYRVVMTKGSTQMDMRGRCSAGQRVLASIVIRLALAETFCVNCGCIALDEPTVNLDFSNKRGLAIALAQIIASRAQQSNFQLVIITHDEDFVGMMKTELSTMTGFSMPEKYFQVRREEGADGKHYSKIDAIDWDELL